MARLVILLLLKACSTGCRIYTNVYAPGATGRVVDAVTGAPVTNACITRPFVPGGYSWSQRVDVPPDGLPPFAVVAGKRGDFDLPPAARTHVVFLNRGNPYSITGSFFVSADGYATNELHGVATERTSWRAEFGQILLSRP
jgi:hypothetical protein